jgi:hypothetical protein
MLISTRTGCFSGAGGGTGWAPASLTDIAQAARTPTARRMEYRQCIAPEK